MNVDQILHDLTVIAYAFIGGILLLKLAEFLWEIKKNRPKKIKLSKEDPERLLEKGSEFSELFQAEEYPQYKKRLQERRAFQPKTKKEQALQLFQSLGSYLYEDEWIEVTREEYEQNLMDPILKIIAELEEKR